MAIPNLRNMINVYSRTTITPIRYRDSYMVSPMREVVLKTQLHCGGCIKKLTTILFKIKGVELVAINVKEELIKVQGTMDTKELPACLMKKHNRKVEVVTDVLVVCN